MYAVINKLGYIISFEMEPNLTTGYDYVPVPEAEVSSLREARHAGKLVKHTNGRFETVEPYRSKTWEDIREERKPKLEEADAKIFKLRDAEILESVDNSQQIAHWAQYRQDLRDITTQEHPDRVVWPEVPV